MHPLNNCQKRLIETNYNKWELRHINKVAAQYVSEAFQDKVAAEQLLKICNKVFKESFQLVESREQKGYYRVLIPIRKIPASSYALTQESSFPKIFLSKDLLFQIVSYLSIKDLGQLMCVNRKCYALANVSAHWNKIALREGLVFLHPEVHAKNQLRDYFQDLETLKDYLKNNYRQVEIPGLHSSSDIKTIQFLVDKQEYLFGIQSHFVCWDNDSGTDVEAEINYVNISKEQVEAWIQSMKASPNYR